MRDIPDALPAVLEAAFRLLAAGASDRDSPFHTPTLATLDAEGAPQARTLVLRGFDPQARLCRLHTDRRSAKTMEVLRDPRAALHVHDAQGAVQIRLTGRVTLHVEDAVAEEAWTASRPSSRLCYSIVPGPGTPVDAPPDAPTETEGGRQHFAVLLFRFDRLEWLHLHAAGHRRARFDWDTVGAPKAAWLVP